MRRRAEKLAYDIRHLIKSCGMVYLVSTIVLCAFLISIGVTAYMQVRISQKEAYFDRVYQGRTFYALRDDLLNPERFYDFRQDAENIDRIGDFYNALNSATSFDYSAVSSQPVPIDNFKGDKTFSYHSEAFIKARPEKIANVKSVQMNRTAYNLYEVAVSSGSGVNWDEVDYASDEVPILLGSAYQGIYEVGDRLQGDFYNRHFKFAVTGFLEPNTFIHYKGDPEFYLDRYLVLPYPESCPPVDQRDFVFEGILYFAMVNGDLVSRAPKDALLYELEQIAAVSGFSEFSVVGLPELSARYSEWQSVIQENRTLLYTCMAMLFAMLAFIQYGIGQWLLKQREAVYSAYWAIGAPAYRTSFRRELCVPFVVGFLLATGVLKTCFGGVGVVPLGAVGGSAAALFMVTYAACQKSWRQAVLKKR